MTPFQRVNLGIGLAALALVTCMAIGQSQSRLGAEAGPGSAYGTR
jgi:hypothetical protein